MFLPDKNFGSGLSNGSVHIKGNFKVLSDTGEKPHLLSREASLKLHDPGRYLVNQYSCVTLHFDNLMGFSSGQTCDIVTSNIFLILSIVT